MRHVLPIKKFSVLMAVLHHLIPPVRQTSFDPNTTLYLITSQAERVYSGIFVSQCQRTATVGFFQPSLNSQTLSYIY